MTAPNPSPAWIATFAAPPRTDRPQPLWSWNADLDEARIDAMLAQFAAQGCGGTFIHARPGLVTDYLSQRWFELWRHAARRSAELGMDCHIYDENSFPSGFSGGHVVSSDPLTAAHLVRGTVAAAPVPPAGPVLACADPATGAHLPPDAWKQASEIRPVLVLCDVPDRPSAWHAGFALPDISLPWTGKAFIATTHAAYAAAVGPELRANGRYVFTDEPTLASDEDALTWSGELAREFAAEHGYRLEDRLALLFVDGLDHQALRHDYYATLNRMVCANFFKPVHDWCAGHGLAFTGHVDEHLWPQPSFLPSSAAALRWMQAPGNDLLGFQFFPGRPDDLRVRIARLNLRELDSVARQCGRDRRLVESCGGGGYGYGPADMKPLEDWAMALGVDLMSPHLAHVSLAGCRKYDWAQSMSDHSPWWDDYRPHADHVARTIAALRQGRVDRRVLVLMPTTSAWLHARPGRTATGPLLRIRDLTLGLVDALEAAGVDYDLGDETILAELGSVADGALAVGACRYRAIVVPAAMGNIEASTLDLLRAALGAGVPVHAEAGCRPAFVAGRPDARPAAIAAAAGWCDHADAEALARAVATALVPQLATIDGSALPAGLAWRRSETPDGCLFFLCNPWDAPLRTTLRLPGSGLLALDTRDGTATAIASRRDGGGQAADLLLPARGHALWLCTQAPVACPVRPAWRPAPVSPAGIAADHPNLLVLDHPELRLPGRQPVAGIAPRIDNALWQGLGFPATLWDKAIQFRRTTIDRDLAHLPGFRVAYRADAMPGAPFDDVRLALERPWLWQVSVNGRPVDGWQRWFDVDMAAAPVGPLLRHGRNEIVLRAAHPHPLHEIAPAYLLGGFGLLPQAHGFALSPTRDLGLGLWRDLGRPLACGRMAYAWHVLADAPRRRIRAAIPGWRGATWRLRLDGRDLATAAHGEDVLEAASDIEPGLHRLEVVIASHPAGMLGPHHADGLPGRWTWERSWEAIQPEPPPGEAWRSPACGLTAAPEVLFA